MAKKKIMKQPSAKVNYNIIFVLTLVHFTGDFYSSFFTPLLPAFVDKLGLTLTLGVVMAQKLAPGSRSMVASLMMGFAYGLGGAVSPFIGKLADIYGLETVLLYSAFIPIIYLVLIARFPSTK